VIPGNFLKNERGYMSEYLELNKLTVYQLAREISKLAWVIYEKFDWQKKKVIGDQMIRSADSIGANIAEGYGRFHYLDKIRFYYNSRGSYYEFIHWLDLLVERELLAVVKYNQLMVMCKYFVVKLNNYISSTYRAKDKDK
jgi:four helix bundle protein